MNRKPEKRNLLKGTILGGLLTALVLAGVFGLGFLLGPITLHGAFAAPPAQTAINNQPAATTGNQSGNHQSKQYYMDLLEQNLASSLGVDKTKLDSALVSAVSATADQAVHNGDITQQQAADLKTAAGKGLGTFTETVVGTDGNKTNKPDPNTDTLMNVALTEAATRLGYASRDDMMAAMKNGTQSLAQIAQAKNITPQALQDAMLHAAKATADSNVASGKWTRAQADDAYKNVTNMIGKIVSGRVSDNNGPADELVQAGFHAGAQLVGVSDLDWAMLIKRDDKSLPQIAQEHNVTLDALRNAILQAARAQANQLVSSGKWTQAQADEAYNGFNNLVQKLSAGPLSGAGPDASK